MVMVLRSTIGNRTRPAGRPLIQPTPYYIDLIITQNKLINMYFS